MVQRIKSSYNDVISAIIFSPMGSYGKVYEPIGEFY